MNKELIAHLEYLLCTKIQKTRAISGGDISKAYLLETDGEHFFCKINSETYAQRMFQEEKLGLEAIASTKTIKTPKVLLYEPLEKGALLLMEYISQKKADKFDMKHLGHQLAMLHELSESNTFGWKTDNFIGSLPQSNISNTDWNLFFAKERILPQLRLARDKNRLLPIEIPSESQWLKLFENYFPEVVPSLLHGDLWSGNYVISTDSTPYLIDPSVYYGHHEVDLAMTRLFGGFDTNFYEAYHDIIPKENGVSIRMDLYQLYYLLVHLNLFGNSYYYQVLETLKRYF
ncbi:fructosamine kinase family protein [Maribacter sp. 2210JD10-5]|uniref:fructosamine kinase family protein n=1 Tax=Maribacter sp. 2210JD10-5 TaxID=3386272 RepID=UPI0039BC32C0